MMKTALAVLGAFCLTVPQVHGAEPSFDCAKAEHEVEELICKDEEHAALDHSLAKLYAVLMKNTPASEQKLLKAEQRGWVKGRNDCWKSDDQRGCVKDSYETRISELKDSYLGMNVCRYNC